MKDITLNCIDSAAFLAGAEAAVWCQQGQGLHRRGGPVHPVPGAPAGVRLLGRAEGRYPGPLEVPLRLVLQVTYTSGALPCQLFAFLITTIPSGTAYFVGTRGPGLSGFRLMVLEGEAH